MWYLRIICRITTTGQSVRSTGQRSATRREVDGYYMLHRLYHHPGLLYDTLPFAAVIIVGARVWT